VIDGPRCDLTEREWQIAYLIGPPDLSYEEVGRRLFMSKHTVRGHVQRMALKFDNPDNLEPRVLVHIWSCHAEWRDGRVKIKSIAPTNRSEQDRKPAA